MKEKFGDLRIYLRYGPGDDANAAEDLADAAVEESARTCEMCGAPGEARPGGWTKTLCNGCYAPRIRA